MAEQTLQQKISELISHNETESAFELLSSVQFNHVDKELIILNGQYNRIQEEPKDADHSNCQWKIITP